MQRPGTGSQPLQSTATAMGVRNDGVQDIRSIREQIRAKKNRWNSKVAASAWLLVAVCCVGYQTSANRERRTLLEAGHRTQGTLENITRTTHSFFWPSYTFDVSYMDDAGAPHRETMDANAELFTENTIVGGKFTHHMMEVVFLPDHPHVAGLPKALGNSVWVFVIAIVPLFLGLCLFGSLIRRR